MTTATLETPVHPMHEALRVAQVLLTHRIKYTQEILAEHLLNRRWSLLPGFEQMVKTLEECRPAFVKAQQEVATSGPVCAARKLLRSFDQALAKADEQRALAIAEERWTDVVRHDAEGTAYIMAKRLAEDETKAHLPA